MARRNDNTREELKKMSVNAGIELLKEEGGSALSARKIAARIGYTVGTLYNVFADLEDMILFINTATLQDMYAQLAPLAKTKQPPAKRILAFAHSYGDYAMAHPARWSLLHNSPRSTPLPQWFHSEIEKIFNLVEQPLAELSGNQAAARTSAKILWAGLHGICALSISQKLESIKAGPLRTLIDDFIIHYVKGLQNG